MAKEMQISRQISSLTTELIKARENADQEKIDSITQELAPLNVEFVEIQKQIREIDKQIQQMMQGALVSSSEGFHLFG